MDPLLAKQAKSSISSNEQRDCDHRVLYAIYSKRKDKKERKKEKRKIALLNFQKYFFKDK